MAKNQRVHIFYSGQVHGVGFRFTAEALAAKRGLTGFVKNLADGRVEVVCEGDVEALEDLIAAVKDRMSGYISDMDVEWEPSKREFASFEIRF